MERFLLLNALYLTVLTCFVSGGVLRYQRWTTVDPIINVVPRKHDLCSWNPLVHWSIKCELGQFECSDGKCIDHERYCDHASDCGRDYSDEHYCSYGTDCPDGFIRCKFSSKCVPSYFFCDGIADCPDGDDEIKENCNGTSNKTVFSIPRAREWIYNQKKSISATETWGVMIDKLAVSLYFAELNFTHENHEVRKNLAYEISLQLLHRLSMKKLQDIPSTDLASIVNALIVTCMNPRKFYGHDIVQELRTRVNRQNYTNPYVLLALCNAGDPITERDKMKLIDTFRNKRRTFWTDIQATVVMAMSCAFKQQGNDADFEQLNEFTKELKNHQSRNGSVENLQTTALVLQALLSAESERDPDNFDEDKALDMMLQNQELDGSFGDLMNTYFVIPVLSCKSFVDINSDHCSRSVEIDEISALESLANRNDTKVRVQYSLWIGDGKDLERYLALRAPANMSLYGIMEIAAEVDFRYKFEYIVNGNKPYINAISGYRDNPEKGKFWFLYTIKDEKPSPSQESPADVIPKENEHYVMWYHTASWIE